MIINRLSYAHCYLLGGGLRLPLDTQTNSLQLSNQINIARKLVCQLWQLRWVELIHRSDWLLHVRVVRLLNLSGAEPNSCKGVASCCYIPGHEQLLATGWAASQLDLLAESHLDLLAAHAHGTLAAPPQWG